MFPVFSVTLSGAEEAQLESCVGGGDRPFSYSSYMKCSREVLDRSIYVQRNPRNPTFQTLSEEVFYGLVTSLYQLRKACRHTNNLGSFIHHSADLFNL